MFLIRHASLREANQGQNQKYHITELLRDQLFFKSSLRLKTTAQTNPEYNYKLSYFSANNHVTS